MSSTAAEMKRETAIQTLQSRSDFAVISRLVQPRSLVLDLGCGDGELLAWLAEHKQVRARGVELSSASVQRAISRGVSVYQGDIDQGLADYPDQAFDYVILSQTLQEVRHPLQVLREMLRVGKRIIVSFPNFGHWSVRLTHLWSGGAPKTKLFPYDWYDSPNIHFLTVKDFQSLVEQEKWVMESAVFLSHQQEIELWPNLRAEVAVFELRR